MERNFAAAQSRAREIGSALAAATEGASQKTTGQFESMRENAARERELTERALKEAYDQANAQLSNIMDQAAQKFRASVAEVKDMASSVQRELDETRGELKRGVFELPKETSEAAEAMRRVVGDQIKALKELAAVVAPHGFDLSEPDDEPAPPPPPPRALETTPRREPALRGTDAPEAPAPAAPGPVLVLPPLRETPPPAPAPAPATLDAPRPPLRPVAPPPAPGVPPAAARAQSGWLSNLLAAASREPEEPRSPLAPRRPANEGLDSITTDIARLVDDAAAADMWERWRQGDTDAISRRLYTAAGAQAFDDIRRRVQNEPAFRESVARYVTEFERLLAKIGQNDRDGARSRAAILSDSGKVYMMLAHASDRLG